LPSEKTILSFIDILRGHILALIFSN